MESLSQNPVEPVSCISKSYVLKGLLNSFFGELVNYDDAELAPPQSPMRKRLFRTESVEKISLTFDLQLWRVIFESQLSYYVEK